MKETSFSEIIFINGTKTRLASYDNGTHRILYFCESLGAGIGVQDLIDNNISRHQFNNSIEIPSADATGVQSVFPGAVIDFPGTPEYEARVNAAAGSRGGKRRNQPTSTTSATSTTSTTSDDSVPSVSSVVVSSDSFVTPDASSVPALAPLLSLIPDLSKVIKDFGANFAMSLMDDDTDRPETPERVSVACQVVPALSGAFEDYKKVVETAVAEYQVEKARKQAEEDARKQAEELEKSGKTLIALSDGSKVEVTGKVHPAFREVLEDLKEFKCVYLHGEAGTGKSFMARQLAEALGVECYISSQSTLKYDLLGTYNAKGEHIYTAFTRAALNGGVWLWDEYDRSSPDSCTAINDALANGRVDIPGVGMVELHKDFYCIAAGNTCGFGGSSKYTAAQQQDFASLTRFLSKIYIGYCREMDMIVTNNDSSLCDFVESVRKAIKGTGIEIDVPIRVLKPLQAKAKRTSKARALECCLFAGIGTTQVRQIANRVIGSGAWFDALQEYSQSLPA